MSRTSIFVETAHPFSVTVMVRLLLGLMLSLPGCAAIDIANTDAIPKTEGIVIGRVNVIRDGQSITLGSMGSQFLSLLPDSSSNLISAHLSSDGYFYWHLPPGGYTIVNITWSPGFGWRTARVWVHFNVPEPQHVTYVGSLKLTFVGSRFNVSVEDEYRESLERARTKFPEMKVEPNIQLLQLERLP